MNTSRKIFDKHRFFASFFFFIYLFLSPTTNIDNDKTFFFCIISKLELVQISACSKILDVLFFNQNNDLELKITTILFVNLSLSQKDEISQPKLFSKLSNY